MYRRHGGVFYVFDRQTKQRESLQTTDKKAALARALYPDAVLFSR